MPSEMSALELGVNEIRERNGELQLVKGLNEVRFDAIRLLLQGQSLTDVHHFEKSVSGLIEQGFELTSLVAELRCPAGSGAPKTWTCAVRPKIGAKPTEKEELKGGLPKSRETAASRTHKDQEDTYLEAIMSRKFTRTLLLIATMVLAVKLAGPTRRQL